MMIGTVETTKWRTVAADVDGVPQAAEVGKLTERHHVYYAWKVEIEHWAAKLRAVGYEVTIGSAAASYYGPTDAPGNCWFATAERTAE